MHVQRARGLTHAQLAGPPRQSPTNLQLPLLHTHATCETAAPPLPLPVVAFCLLFALVAPLLSAAMDSVTQLQNYLSSITSFMTHSLQHATHGSQTVSVDQLTEALMAEHQQHRDLQAAAASASASAAGGAATAAPKSSLLPTIAEGEPAAATATTSQPTDPIPDLAAPLYSGLAPSVEFAMCDRAHQLFKRVLEADVLLASLPTELGPEAQKRQLAQIAYLESYNEKAGQELADAQAEARLWQQRVSAVLQQAAACQLSTTYHAQSDNDTKKEDGAHKK